MNDGPVFKAIAKRAKSGWRSYWVLLDPDDYTVDKGAEMALRAQDAGVDALLIGGSLIHTNRFGEFVRRVRESVSIPAILFPGDATQLSADANAILFLSLISGRNPVNLIGEHVKAAPRIKELGLEAIPTAYMLVESGAVTSVEFMSNTRPLPRGKPAIAAAHALAAEYMGMKAIYLEAGSGAPQTVPNAMVSLVRSQVDIPLIVGGGIRSVEAAQEKYDAGADIVVTGNMLQQADGLTTMKRIAGLLR
ncbi:MAG: geranylgeranylglyceryl/heptaprenylglyceryl phosphate synthase [Chitinivibrionales bacterium]|nr:geranylgeranylglyceryl/heptaprenylglyceryl phosphate synthase [Chitinivibrionales bacterium]